MTTPPPRDPGAPALSIGFREFVALVACLMAVTALGIDTMLPALPQIGHSLGMREANQQQWIVAIYMMGFGLGQIIYGPLGDRFGRRPPLMVGLVLFAIASLAAGLAQTFEQLIVLRLLQGLAAASARVLTISVVRDCYAGRQMARVMSLAFIVFLAVPVLAPSIGTLILAVGSWRLIFLLLAGFGLFVLAFFSIRLGETLHPENRRPISIGGLRAAAARVITNRYSIGYTLGTTLMYGALMAFITAAQQIFADVFGAAKLFPPLFAASAGAMAVASFVNSRIVERIGTRRVSHAALLAFIGFALVHFLIVRADMETLSTFAILQAGTMASFALAVSNFNAMAMDPMGDIAGTASSIQGTISTVIGAGIGIAVGQQFDGTTLPLVTSYVILGAATLAIVTWVERGRLFAPLRSS